MKPSIFSPLRGSRSSREPQPSDHSAAPLTKISAPVASLEQLRAQILERITRAVVILAAVIVLVNLPNIFRTQRWGALFVFAGLEAVLILSGFSKRLSYPLRMAVFMGTVYLAGVLVLLNNGLNGPGRVILVGVPIFATLLGGRRVRFTGAALSMIAMLAVGALAVIGIIPSTGLSPASSAPALWLTAIVSVALVGLTATGAFGMLVDGLKTSLSRQEQLGGELETERTALELRVQQRTHSLERRLVQIRTAAEITRQISRQLDINALLPEVCELMRARLNLYYVGVFLLEKSDQEARPGESRYMALAAGSGEAGRQMLAEHHRLLVGGDSMIGWSAANRQARIALDVGREAVRFNNPHLPRTRSELALPIIAGGSSEDTPLQPSTAPASLSQDGAPEGPSTPTRLLGAITVQSDAEAAFDEDDIIVLQAIADALAAAIDNARLFAATQAALEEVSSLHRQYLQTAWSGLGQAAGGYTYVDPTIPAKADEASSPPFEAAIQLRSQVIGRLVLERDANAPPWTPEQISLIESVTTQAALALENARLLEETRRQADQERVISQITSHVWASNDIDTIIRQTLQELGSNLHATEGRLELWPEEGAGPYTPAPTPVYPQEEAGDVVA